MEKDFSRRQSSAGGSLMDLEGGQLECSSSKEGLKQSYSTNLLSSAIANILNINSVRVIIFLIKKQVG